MFILFVLCNRLLNLSGTFHKSDISRDLGGYRQEKTCIGTVWTYKDGIERPKKLHLYFWRIFPRTTVAITARVAKVDAANGLQTFCFIGIQREANSQRVPTRWPQITNQVVIVVFKAGHISHKVYLNISESLCDQEGATETRCEMMGKTEAAYIAPTSPQGQSFADSSTTSQVELCS